MSRPSLERSYASLSVLRYRQRPSWYRPTKKLLQICCFLILGVSPTAGQFEFDRVFNLPGDVLPSTVPANSQINVTDGGRLRGAGNDGYRLIGSMEGMSENVELNITGGVATTIFMESGARANLSGGQGSNILVQGNAQADISGGQWHGISLRDEASLSLSGGIIVDRALEISFENRLTISGDNFFVDGVRLDDFTSAQVAIPGGSTITGRLADGTSFGLHRILNSSNSDPAIVSLERTPLPEPVNRDYVVPRDIVPMTLATGDTLTTVGEVEIPNLFKALPGSRVELGPGASTDIFSALGAEVHINGGSLSSYEATAGTKTLISDGGLRHLSLLRGSETTITGWDTNPNLIEDNTFGLVTFPGSSVNFVAFEPTLNGESISGLQRPGDQVIVERLWGPDEQVAGGPLVLRGGFLNGVDLEIDLNQKSSFGFGTYDQFHVDSAVQVTMAFPDAFCDLTGDGVCDVSDFDSLLENQTTDNPSYDLNYSGSVDGDDLTILLSSAGQANSGVSYRRGDANLDGRVDATDLNVVALHWQQAGDFGWSGGDFDGDGVVNASDLNAIGLGWDSAFAAAAVPEPGHGAAQLLVLALAVSVLVRKRKWMPRT